MTFSLSVDRWPALAPAGPYRPGLPPEVLREAGILTDPNHPEQAFRRAKLLVQRGQYREARGLLYPHGRHATGQERLRIMELLARCAMGGGGGDWEQLLSTTLTGYAEAGDLLSAARTRRYLGEMLLNVGRLREADRHLADARALFARFNETARAAMVECLRARVRLRAGFIKAALKRIHAAVLTLEPLGQPRALALARLVRARVLANLGEAVPAARDLVAAEQVLGASGSGLDRVRAKLVRAECLTLLGEPLRAVNGLKRLLVDVVELEETSTRAWVHTLMGEALLEADAAGARRHLMRARHLYGRLHFSYHVARCDVTLARAELRMGLNAKSRLNEIDRSALGEWPLVAAHLQIALAEVAAAKDATGARERLFKAHGFAVESGDRSLLQEVDRVLRHSRLVANDDDCTLADAVGAQALVQAGTTPGPIGLATPRRAPEPLAAEAAHAEVVHWKEAVKLVQPEVKSPADQMLKPPRRVTGVRS